jgi:pimeloyl-ACP methyl ester carboxylesterase
VEERQDRRAERRRHRLVVLAACLAVAACGHEASLPATTPEAPLTARYAVGLTQIVWTDTSRSTPQNGAEPAHAARRLPTRIWYPAVGAVDAAVDAAVTNQAAPLPGRFAAVLFVHGSAGSAALYSKLCAALAGRGYVVAGADFPLTALSTPGGPSDWHAEEQHRDLIFLADQLLGSGAPTLLQQSIDAAKGYAVVGHSTGGTIALLAAFAPELHDPRLRAAADLSGDSCFFADTFFATRPTPFLAVAASDDLLVPPANNPVRAFELGTGPAVLARLRGATHLQMTNLAINDPTDALPTGLDDPLAQTMAQWGSATACRPVPPPGDDPKLGHDQQLDLTATVVRAFFDAYVYGAPAGLAALQTGGGPNLTLQVK